MYLYNLDTLLDITFSEVMFMDKRITKDMYNRKNTQLVNRQHEINTLLEQHHSGNGQFTTFVIKIKQEQELLISINGLKDVGSGPESN